MYSLAGIVCIRGRHGVQLIPRAPSLTYTKIDIIVREPDTIYASDGDKTTWPPALPMPKELVAETEKL